MTFSIIVVCLDAGDKLRKTVESIQNQTQEDYEIVIKDGGSKDAFTLQYLEKLRKQEGFGTRIRVFTKKDGGIYDAMNQAVQYAEGRYVLFLNCGDCFYGRDVLEQVQRQIAAQEGMEGLEEPDSAAKQRKPCIFYGNIYERLTDTLVQSNPSIDDFACYRNLPCHQACFYDIGLLRRKAFDTSYAVRADYEQFLWCYYKAHAKMVYMPVTVAFYEGGGFSETYENKKRSKREHREIVGRYMPAAKVRRYRFIMLLTLAPLRTWIAGNRVTAGIYQKMKKKLFYRNRSE